MLPFSTPAFFAGLLAVAVGLRVFRGALAAFVPFRTVLFAASAAYALWAFPNPTDFAALVLFQYLVALAAKRGAKIGVCVVLCLIPMVAAKAAAPLSVFHTIGLSFMTFRAIRALFDVRELDDVPFVDYALFVAFPLTILAGPLDHFRSFRVRLDAGYTGLSGAAFGEGLTLLAMGATQKFLIADPLAQVLRTLAIDSYALGDMAANAYCYSAYLYFDFAGYSAMAIGGCALFGFRLGDNFDRPYLALNPPDFWRRWHRSLGEWLRDFVFMPVYRLTRTSPLFAERKLLAQNLALFLTLFSMGIWNGLSTHYIVSGIYFGALSVA